MTTLAEKYQADVVHTDEFFYFHDEKFKNATTEELMETEKHVVIRCNPNYPRLNLPTYASNNFDERMNLWLNSNFHWATWALFCRRDFLVINQINFPNMPMGGDITVNFRCLCLADKILRVPTINYIYRERLNSVSHGSVTLEKYFKKVLNSLNNGFNTLDKFMNRFEFFNAHPDYRYAILNWFFEKVIQQGRQIAAAYDQIHAFQLNALVKKEFHPDDAAFSSYLFDMVNIQRLQIMQLQAELSKFQHQ